MQLGVVYKESLTDAKMGEDVFERFICGDFSTCDFCQMVQA